MSRPLLKFKPITIQHEGTLDIEQSDLGFEDSGESIPDEERMGSVTENKNPSYLENIIAMIPASIIVTWGIMLGLYETGLIGPRLIGIGFAFLAIATIPFIYVTIDEKERQSQETYKMAIFQCLAGVGAFVIYAIHLNATTPVDAFPWLPWEISIGVATFAVALYTVAIPAIVQMVGMYNDWQDISRPADPAT